MAIWWTEVDLRDKHGSAPEANDLVLQERNHDCQKRGHDAESGDLLGNGHQRSRCSGWLRSHAGCVGLALEAVADESDSVIAGSGFTLTIAHIFTRPSILMCHRLISG